MVTLNSIFYNLIIKEALEKCPSNKVGRPRALSNECALTEFFKILRTGMQWREVTVKSHYTTLLRRMHLWTREGVFETAYAKAIQTYKKLVPTKFYCVDSSYVKNAFGREGVGKNHTDRGRKALKLSVISDHTGMPHGMCCHPGNRPDVCLFKDSIASMVTAIDEVSIYADRGYDSKHNRGVCNDNGLKDRIFRRKSKTVRRTNAKRIVVEHCFAWAHNFRRLLKFYDQTPSLYKSWAFLAYGHLVGGRIIRFRGNV